MIQRLLVILIALVLSGIIAILTFFLAAWLMGRGGPDDAVYVMAMAWQAWHYAPRLITGGAVALCFAVVPLAGAILLFEALRLRAWTWYALAALAIALGGTVMYGLVVGRFVPPSVGLPPALRPGTLFAILSVLAALAASTVYWAIAGRKAGAGGAYHPRSVRGVDR